jgi:hypothetical protein
MEHFWKPIIESVATALKPSVIVEVGSAGGSITPNLLHFCEETQSVLHLIDTRTRLDVKGLQNKHGSRFVYHNSPGLEALPQVGPMDLVLINGDPNWYTVFNQLKLIERGVVQNGHRFPCVLVHQIGWPYGRRDGYFNPETIPEEYRQPCKKQGIAPGAASFADKGGLFPERYHSIYENDLRNGVLTAVEDFQKDGSKSRLWVPVFSHMGLGLLFSRELAETNQEFSSLIKSLSLSPPLESLFIDSEQSRQQAEALLEEFQAQREEEASDAAKNLKQLQKEKEGLRNQLARKSRELDKTTAELTRASRERDTANRKRAASEKETLSLRAKLEVAESEKRDQSTSIASLQTRLEAAERMTRERATQADSLKNRSDVLTARLSRYQHEYKAVLGDVQRLIRWLQLLSNDMDTHLHSISWKIGSLTVGLGKSIIGKDRKPVTSFRAYEVMKSFEEWLSRYRPPRPVTSGDAPDLSPGTFFLHEHGLSAGSPVSRNRAMVIRDRMERLYQKTFVGFLKPILKKNKTAYRTAQIIRDAIFRLAARREI